MLTSRFDEYYRLCFGKRPREELYRVNDDPDCVKNLAADPGLRPIKQKLREEMEATLRQEGDPRALGRGAVFDTYEYVGPALHSYDSWLKHQRTSRNRDRLRYGPDSPSFSGGLTPSPGRKMNSVYGSRGFLACDQGMTGTDQTSRPRCVTWNSTLFIRARA